MRIEITAFLCYNDYYRVAPAGIGISALSMITHGGAGHAVHEPNHKSYQNIERKQMKRRLLTAAFCAAVLLTGCAGRTAESSREDTTAETDIPQSETTAETTEQITETTTKKADPPADLVMKGMDTVEAGADITLDEFITERNVELKDGSALLDTSKLGAADAEIAYIYGGTEFTQTLHYRVADTVKPHIFDPGERSYHKAGTAFDLNHYVGYGDYFDKAPVLTYEGEIEPDTVGKYPLTATVTDSSGNSASWNLTVHVVEKKPKSEDKIPRVEYSDFIERYKADNVRFGIDVSAWQADIDYNAVRDAGCSFVIIRIGHFYSKVKLDDYFRQNIKNAKEAGLDVGIYFYTTDHSETEVREHVRWIAEQLDGQKLDLPIAFDWEEFSGFQEYGMSIRGLNDVYAAFADEVTKQGYQPMLYGSKNVLDAVWSEKSKRLAPVWLAHYVKETSYKGEYAIWQASAYGHIPGIKGDVDMDIQYLTQKTDG